MGQIGKLIELLARLDELDSEETIYECEPWTADSDAMVTLEDPESGLPFGVPRQAAEAGMTYFLKYSPLAKLSKVGSTIWMRSQPWLQSAKGLFSMRYTMLREIA
jgi:hypothetical protein